MTSLLFYSFSAFGLAYVLGHSVISKRPREALWDFGVPPLRWLVLLLECPACCGFWIGFAFGLVSPEITGHEAGVAPRVLVGVMFACYTAGTNFVLGKFTGLMESQGIKD